MITLGIASTSSAATPDYIEAVKLDVDEFDTKVWTEQPNSSWLPSGTKASVDGSDTLESFNGFLKKRFPGSFILYKKLSPEDQKKVWKNYVNTGNLGGIRSDIYSFRRKNRR
jgi:hypothetical protein